jgi:hypothetical protein
MGEAELQGDNHYVPRLYLKRWADDQQQIWLYRALVSHPNVPVWKKASAKGLAYHKHLYTRVIAAGETDEVEKWLAKEFEDPGNVVIQKAVSGDRLAPEDWECLIRFVALQDARTPARLIEMMDRWSKTLPDMVQTTLNSSVNKLAEALREGRTIERSSSTTSEYFPARITREIEPGAKAGVLKVETVAGRSLWLFALRHLLTDTCRVLLRHKWTILRPPLSMNWATSDDPVIKLNYYSQRKYDFNGGWGSDGTEILFPLGPKHLLHTRIGHRPLPKYQCVPIPTAEAFQRFTIEHAHRFVFAAAQDPLVPTIRPRVVDAARYQHEINQWRRWNEEQSTAERDLYK